MCLHYSHTIDVSHHGDQDFAVGTSYDQYVVVRTRFGVGGSKINSAVVGVGAKKVEAKHVICSKDGDGEQDLVRKLGSKEEEDDGSH